MQPDWLGALLAFLGVGGGLKIILDFVKDWRSGKSHDEKARNQAVLARDRDNATRAICAEVRADCEAANRRKVQEYAADLRGMLLERGVPPDDLPAYPQIASCYPAPGSITEP